MRQLDATNVKDSDGEGIVAANVTPDTGSSKWLSVVLMLTSEGIVAVVVLIEESQ